MKLIKLALTGLIVLTTGSLSVSALAYQGHGHYGGGYHGGGRVGVYFGGPVVGFGVPYYGYGYGYPGYGYGYGAYNYYGPGTTVVTTPVAPPVYIEQNNAAPSGPASDGYWYYCHNPDGYYPYVRQCAEGWQKVPPEPARR